MNAAPILVAGFAACVLASILATLRLPAPDGALFALATLLPGAGLAAWSSLALLDDRVATGLQRCLRERRPARLYWMLRGLATALVATGLTLAFDFALRPSC